jgi:hypothetical protein
MYIIRWHKTKWVISFLSRPTLIPRENASQTQLDMKLGQFLGSKAGLCVPTQNQNLEVQHVTPPSCMQVQVTLAAFDTRGFISILRGSSISCPQPNFKAYYLCRTFSRFIRECDADDKLSIEKFWHQFNIKMVGVICFPFYAFSLYATIRRNAIPVYNKSPENKIERPLWLVNINVITLFVHLSITPCNFMGHKCRPTVHAESLVPIRYSPEPWRRENLSQLAHLASSQSLCLPWGLLVPTAVLLTMRSTGYNSGLAYHEVYWFQQRFCLPWGLLVPTAVLFTMRSTGPYSGFAYHEVYWFQQRFCLSWGPLVPTAILLTMRYTGPYSGFAYHEVYWSLQRFCLPWGLLVPTAVLLTMRSTGSNNGFAYHEVCWFQQRFCLPWGLLVPTAVLLTMRSAGSNSGFAYHEVYWFQQRSRRLDQFAVISILAPVGETGPHGLVHPRPIDGPVSVYDVVAISTPQSCDTRHEL